MGRRITIALVFALAVSLWLPEKGVAGAEGGPSTFGYDAASACGKPYSRVGRARANELPCDFRRENWCTIAGNAYPWQAVRRFVHENQGLMRRMYGDEKHISVLKTELEKNDVELELEDDHNHLYSDDANTLFRQFPLEPDYDLAQGRPSPSEQTGAGNRDYMGRALNAGTSSKFDKPKTEEPPTRHSHPNETPTASTTAHSASTTSTVTTTAATSTTLANPMSSTASSGTTRTTSSQRRRMSPVTTTTTATTATSTTSASTTLTTAPSTTKEAEETNADNVTSTTPVIMLAQIAKIQNLSINEIPGQQQIDRFDDDVDELTEIPEILVEDLPDTTLPPPQDDDDDDGDEVVAFAGYSTAYVVPTSSERTEELKDQVVEASEVLLQQQSQQQKFRPRPEYRPPEVSRPEATGGAMEGQLYQDVAAKDKQDPPVLKVRGINACPVKEEVVAPFWANNTRGEVLALLNLYPFEQYVHWEKCTHENKQMYCRDGCRCEQQYRLHRLLAYDPNNECRGIFSDWFKFPSCCICRCYDLPLEFRVTSRSPRLVQRQRLKVRTPRAPPRQRLYN